MADKRVRIPEEDVVLTPLEIDIMQTRTFHRLFAVKQLGLAYLVYPGATYTRAAHSIQCLGEAEKILQSLERTTRTCRRLVAKERASVRVAALLHDIGHLPFSHTLEDENIVLDKHDRPARLNEVMKQLNQELEAHPLGDKDKAILAEAVAILGRKKQDYDWRNDLIANTVCADLLAYIQADPLFTGIEKRAGYYRLYEYFTLAPIEEKGRLRLCIKLTKGGLRNDTVSAIMDLLDMRYALTERVLFHHAKCVASAMLGRAARLLGLTEKRLQDVKRLYQIGDEEFLTVLEDQAATHAVREEADGAARLLRSLRSRRLYKRIYKVGLGGRDLWEDGHGVGSFSERWRDASQVESALRDVERRAALPCGSLALWCPDADSGMKEAAALVVWDSVEVDGATRTEGPVQLRSKGVADWFPQVGNRVAAIEQQYDGLWSMWVALDREYLGQAASVVSELSKRIGVPCDEVFHGTHLRSVEDFEAAEKIQSDVSAIIGPIEAGTVRYIREHAAEGGKPPDDSVVLKVLLDQTESRLKRRRQRPEEETESLFDDGH